MVVSVDGPRETAMTIARITADGSPADMTFLYDPEHAVIDRYGLLNPQGSRNGIPHPATYVIDREGVVRWRFVETDYTVRPSNEAVLEALRAARGR